MQIAFGRVRRKTSPAEMEQKRSEPRCSDWEVAPTKKLNTSIDFVVMSDKLIEKLYRRSEG